MHETRALGTRPRWTAAGIIGALLWTLATAHVARAGTPVPFATAQFSAAATGSVAHADALRSGTLHAADVELGMTGATLDSGGLTDPYVNEVDRQVQPRQAGKHSYARGSALEAGVGVDSEQDNQIILVGKAEAAAAPSTGPVRETADVSLPPLAYASLLRGEATARWRDDACVLGTDVSNGSAYAADVELLGSGEEEDGSLASPLVALHANDPDRAASNSVSRTRFVPQVSESGDVLGNGVGLMAETRQTIAPVTLFEGTPTEITIELLGEWVLRAVATGQPGGAYVHYGPGELTPQTPILHVFGPGSPLGDALLALQDIPVIGTEGLVLDLGVIEVAIGEDPRAIGGSAASEPTETSDGTGASAAVDVIRVRLLDGDPVADLGLADVRVGHMEVSAQVPQGGIRCGLPVTKVPNPTEVFPGDRFTTTITVENPYACAISSVTIRDDVRTDDEARYDFVSATDGGDYTGDDDSGRIDWALGGSIAAGAERSVAATFEATAGPGTITDEVTARGRCELESADGSVTVDVLVEGGAEADVVVGKVLGETKTLPITGIADVGLPLAGAGLLAAAGLGAVRLRRDSR